MALLRNDQHTLTGVYALDALDTAAEVTRFERHLNRCDSCTSEVRGFRETATRLGMAVAQQPPPTLRAAVIEDAPIVPVTWVCGYAEAPDKMTLHGQNQTNVPAAFLPFACRSRAKK